MNYYINYTFNTFLVFVDILLYQQTYINNE